MHEVAAQAALHHPVGRDRRVEPARQQHQRAPARADRQAAGAAHALDRDEQLLVVDLDEQLEVRVGQVDLEPEPHPHGVAEQARPARSSAAAKRLSRRFARTAKVRPGSSRSSSTAASAAAVASRSQRSAGCTTLTPGRREAALDQLVLRDVAGDDEDPAAVAHLQRPEVGRHAPQVALERGDEARAVAPLQRQLAELEQHAARGPFIGRGER